MILKEIGSKYKVRMDASYEAEKEEGKKSQAWRYQEIPCKYGMIYPFSEDMLGVYLTSKIISNRILEEKGYKMLQNGEDETTFLAPLEDFEYACQMLRAKKRRIGNPANAVHLAKYHFRPLKVS